MKKAKIIKKFSLYINGDAVNVPQNPTCDGDLIPFETGMDIKIGETVSGKELTWIRFQDASGQEAWMCDRCLLNYISRDDCEELIGAEVEVDGVHAVLDLPTMGMSPRDDNSDWTSTLYEVVNEEQLHWRTVYSIGKEIFENSGIRVTSLRGRFVNARKWNYNDTDYRYYDIGWRPVLRNASFPKKYSICSPENLRQLCIQQRWFTSGSNEQYEKLFWANENGFSLQEIALIIWLCSGEEDLEEIMDILRSVS